MTPDKTLQIFSTVHEDATVVVELDEVALPVPGAGDVLVRMEAAPINPSDLGTMFAGADLTTIESVEGASGAGVRAKLREGAQRAARARLGERIALGNEGAGVVIAAGGDAEAQALIGRTVALRVGCYAEYRCLPAKHCLVLPEGTLPAAAASCFVNPLTALGMVDTMRLEGHEALVHTAAASNLGQMLQRICNADGVALVNIVRRPEQVEVLRGVGARHVVDSSAPDFEEALTAALAETGATIAFDATGGGRLASTILASMERALTRGAGYSRYGLTVLKQVYLYGSLQLGATELNRTYGMAWSAGGWLLNNFLRRVGDGRTQELMQRVASELDSTFASHYSATVSLRGALALDAISAFERKATGEKTLITPQTA